MLSVNIENLESRLCDVRSEISELEKSINELEADLRKYREEEKVLQDIVSYYKPDSRPMEVQSLRHPGEFTESLVELFNRKHASNEINPHNGVAIGKLHDWVIQENLRIPAAGSKANLIGVMSRDPEGRFFRPSYGCYSLVEWKQEFQIREYKAPVKKKLRRRARKAR